MRFKLYILLNLFICSIKLCAQHKSELTVVSENDAFIDITSDRYYTNGFFIKYRHALNDLKPNRNIEKRILGIELGQKIYNPYYSFAPDPTTHDRPFSAYLYGEASITNFYTKDRMLKLAAQIGVTGKDALGETFQKAFHKLVGQNKIAGWEYALNSQPTLNLGADIGKKLFSTNKNILDVTGIAGMAVGNVITKASLGTIIRIGKYNTMSNSAAFNSLVSNGCKTQNKNKYELFLSITPQIFAVAYDSSLQGGIFNKDKGPITFNPKPFVLSNQLALTFSIARWTASYNATFITNEVKNSAKGYRYAYYSLAYRFNKD